MCENKKIHTHTLEPFFFVVFLSFSNNKTKMMARRFQEFQPNGRNWISAKENPDGEGSRDLVSSLSSLFGHPTVNITSPFQNQSREFKTVADIWPGENLILQKIINDRQKMQVQWPVQVLFPIVPYSGPDELVTSLTKYDQTVMGLVPPTGAPRIISSHQSESSASIERRGLGIVIENSLGRTPEGEAIFLESVVSLASSCASTLDHGAVHALFNVNQYSGGANSLDPDEDNNAAGFLGNSLDTFEAQLQAEFDSWAITQREEWGYDILISNLERKLRRGSRNANVNFVVIPHGLQAKVQRDPENTKFFLSGRKGGPNRDILDEGKRVVVESILFHVGRGVPKVDHAFRRVAIGTYSLMTRPEHQPPADFQTSHRDIIIYNEKGDSYAKMNFASILMNKTGIYKKNPNEAKDKFKWILTDDLGRDVMGKYVNWYDFFYTHGGFDHLVQQLGLWDGTKSTEFLDKLKTLTNDPDKAGELDNGKKYRFPVSERAEIFEGCGQNNPPSGAMPLADYIIELRENRETYDLHVQLLKFLQLMLHALDGKGFLKPPNKKTKPGDFAYLTWFAQEFFLVTKPEHPFLLSMFILYCRSVPDQAMRKLKLINEQQSRSAEMIQPFTDFVDELILKYYNDLTNKQAAKNAAADISTKLAYRLTKISCEVGDVLQLCLDHNLSIPGDILLLSKDRVYEAGTVLALDVSDGFGVTFLGEQNTEIAKDGVRKMSKVNYTMRHGSMVLNEKSIVAGENAFIRDSISGSGVEFWDPNNPEDVDRSLKGLTAGKHIYACFVPGRFDRQRWHLDVTGTHHPRHNLGEESGDLHFSTARAYAQFYGWRHAMQPSVGNAYYDIPDVNMNTVCCRGYWREWSPHTKSYTEECPGRNHWGSFEGPGHSNIRRGMPYRNVARQL